VEPFLVRKESVIDPGINFDVHHPVVVIAIMKKLTTVKHN
jgi:hypothetical protein